jgi:hypothetical protein
MTTYTGSCHCGTVQFEVDTDMDLGIHCNCSICRRRGALMHRLPEGNLRITAGKDNLTLYQFNTGVAEHFFCKTCGIYPFHRTRRMPEMFCVNVGCLEGVEEAALQVENFDGKALS